MTKSLLAIALLAVSASSMAISPATTPPPANRGSPPKVADARTAQAARDDSAGLRKGAVEAVNVNAGTFHVYGQQLTFDPKRVKVFSGAGRVSSPYAMRRGGRVRFTMDPTDPTHRRVAVIYVE